MSLTFGHREVSCKWGKLWTCSISGLTRLQNCALISWGGLILVPTTNLWREKGDFTARFIMWWGDYNDRSYKQITVTLGSGMCLVSFSGSSATSSEPCDWKLNESQRIIVLSGIDLSCPRHKRRDYFCCLALLWFIVFCNSLIASFWIWFSAAAASLRQVIELEKVKHGFKSVTVHSTSTIRMEKEMNTLKEANEFERCTF